jgi:sugar phosphate isomerase/epimerase
MSESDTTHAAEDSTEDTASSGPNRRRVLQGIGAAGAAIAVGAGGQAGADEPDARTGGVVRDNHSELGDDEIPTSAQFWSFRDRESDSQQMAGGRSVAEIIQACADAGYHAVEPYYLDDEDAIATALDETGLEMGSAHVSLGDIEGNVQSVAETYSQFGEPTLIHPFEGEDTWQTESSVRDFAERMNEVADQLGDHGLTLGYHNHDHEFQTVEDGNTIAYDIFAQNIDDNVHLQIDAGWVLTGGEDPIQYIIDYSDNVGSIHMKNMMDGDFTEIDEGAVGMRGVATAARRAAAVDYLTYEYDAPPNPMESLEIGADWLNELNGPWEPSGFCGVSYDVHPATFPK